MANYKVPLTKVRAVTEEDLIGLPRGFRFHPTDEEIVVHYLIPKALNSNFSAAAIGQADFNKCEPWDLPKKANMGDTERFYYCQRDRKYPSGLRTNRATKAGYWKATGKDKEIYKAGMGNGSSSRVTIGMKKTLVFYTGRAPNGEKTNWVMHEYRLIQPGFSSIPKDDGWVVSRVFHKTGSSMHKRTSSSNSSLSPVQERPDSFSTDELIIRDDHDHFVETLPPLVDPSSATHQQVQDMKQKATMPIIISNYGLQHQPPANIAGHSSSSIIHYACHDDDQLIYSHDPSYYYLSTSETLFETLDSLGYENTEHKNNKQNVVWSMMDDNKCKVEHQSASSAAIIGNNDINNVEVSSNDQEYDRFLSSTLGSMPDLSKLWDY